MLEKTYPHLGRRAVVCVSLRVAVIARLDKWNALIKYDRAELYVSSNAREYTAGILYCPENTCLVNTENEQKPVMYTGCVCYGASLVMSTVTLFLVFMD